MHGCASLLQHASCVDVVKLTTTKRSRGTRPDDGTQGKA